MNHQPLVTVGVLTYNSSRFLIEALESVKNQTYKNIELVISDDCSTDNSVEISQKWLSENKERFVRSDVLTVKKNTGISGNCNRSLMWAEGKWIKDLAGDDMLTPNAIEEYVDYVKEHSNSRYVLGGVIKIDESSNEIPNGRGTLIEPFYYSENFSVARQAWFITKSVLGVGSSFASVKTLKDVGGYDERFPMIEDYPMAIKLTHYGIHLDWMGKYTLYYRIQSQSIMHTKDNDSAIYGKGETLFIKEYKYIYRREYLGFFWRRLLDIELLWKNVIINSGNSCVSTKCRIIYKMYRVLSPFSWVEHYLYVWRKSNGNNK